MGNKQCTSYWITLIMLTAVLITGCSLTQSISRKIEEPKGDAVAAEARSVLSTVSNQNKTLKNFKGIGKIKIQHHGKIKIDERIAWIGSEAVKLRIVVLISGHSAIKIASDGEWFYYYEAGKSQPIFKKIPATDASLKRIISISIQPTEIIDLLAGRVPLREHHSALLHRQDFTKGYVLVLKKRWWGVTEKIFLDETKTQVLQLEFYNRSGSLIYRVLFNEMQTIKGYRVPLKLSIANDQGVDFQLSVDRYWADVHVNPSMFVLHPPD